MAGDNTGETRWGAPGRHAGQSARDAYPRRSAVARPAAGLHRPRRAAQAPRRRAGDVLCGFDPTAASLHVGHLVQVLTARRLQLAGHRPLLLVGGATGQIGDPQEAGERTLNPPEVVAGWVDRIRRQLAPFVDLRGRQRGHAGQQPRLDRADVGHRVPARRRQALPGQQDARRARWSRPGWRRGISFTEFSYQLLQSHDFYELHQRHGCTLQFGGSDQWGNITAGVDYVRRRGAGPVHAFTTPLVTKADGTKFGKTEGGAIWLDPEMTSPYAFYQFWFNTDDARRRALPEVLQLPHPRGDRGAGAGRPRSGRPPGRRSGRWPRS